MRRPLLLDSRVQKLLRLHYSESASYTLIYRYHYAEEELFMIILAVETSTD